MNKKIGLSHTILYAKGWYKRSDDIVSDLIKILNLDNIVVYSKHDIFLLLSNKLKYFDGADKSIELLCQALHPDNCWKYGYHYKKQNKNQEYDYELAVIYYVLHLFTLLTIDKFNFIAPDYNSYPASDDVTDEMLEWHFGVKFNDIIK